MASETPDEHAELMAEYEALPERCCGECGVSSKAHEAVHKPGCSMLTVAGIWRELARVCAEREASK